MSDTLNAVVKGAVRAALAAMDSTIEAYIEVFHKADRSSLRLPSRIRMARSILKAASHGSGVLLSVGEEELRNKLPHMGDYIFKSESSVVLGCSKQYLTLGDLARIAKLYGTTNIRVEGSPEGGLVVDIGRSL